MATISLRVQPFGGLRVGTVFLANANPGLATVGVKRNSDNFVLVSAETPMVQSGSDPELYTYSTTLLDPLTDYTAYIRVEFLNADNTFNHYEIATAAVLGISSPTTLRKLRRRLIQKLGSFVFQTATVTGPDANSVTCSNLIYQGGFPDTYDKGWIYICSGASAGSIAKVKADGFNPDSGQLSVVRNWPATIQQGTEFEWSARMPAISSDKMSGCREAINEALSMLWTIDRVELPTAAGLYTDMNTFDWLRHKSQVIGAEWIGSGEEYPVSYNDVFQFRYDAEQPLLIGPPGLSTTDRPLSVSAYRPLNTWIKRGGAWQDADGLVDDTDECLGDPQLVLQVALYCAYKMLANNPYESVTERERWEVMAQRQSVIAENIKRYQSPEEQPSSGVAWGWEPWSKELIKRRI